MDFFGLIDLTLSILLNLVVWAALLLIGGTISYQLLRVLVGNFLDVRKQIPLFVTTAISGFLLARAWGSAENGGVSRAIAVMLGIVTFSSAGALLTRISIAHLRQLKHQNQSYQIWYNSLTIEQKQLEDIRQNTAAQARELERLRRVTEQHDGKK
jgi:hypothetical protein